MLTLDRARTGLLSLPLITRIGLAILVLGGLADVAAHLEANAHSDHLHEHTISELSAHLIAFVGMVATLLGVVLDGARRSHFGHRGRAAARSAARSRVLPD
jgi:hypothetical protein